MRRFWLLREGELVGEGVQWSDGRLAFRPDGDVAVTAVEYRASLENRGYESRFLDPPEPGGEDDRTERERVTDRALLTLILRSLEEDLGHPEHMHETVRRLLPVVRDNCERYARRLR